MTWIGLASRFQLCHWCLVPSYWGWTTQRYSFPFIARMFAVKIAERFLIADNYVRGDPLNRTIWFRVLASKLVLQLRALHQVVLVLSELKLRWLLVYRRMLHSSNLHHLLLLIGCCANWDCRRGQGVSLWCRHYNFLLMRLRHQSTLRVQIVSCSCRMHFSDELLGSQPWWPSLFDSGHSLVVEVSLSWSAIHLLQVSSELLCVLVKLLSDGF